MWATRTESALETIQPSSPSMTRLTFSTILTNALVTANSSTTSLIRKDAQVKSASAASLTISILQDFQNNKTEFLKVSESEKAVFNQTIKTISEQGQNFSDTKTLNWIKEINQAAKKINLVWSIVSAEPVIDTNFDNSSDQQEHLVVVL